MSQYKNMDGIQLSFMCDDQVKCCCSFSVNERFDVHDERFGSTRSGAKCTTCGKTEKDGCYGHYGSLYLGCQILHPMFLKNLAEAVNKVCQNCGTKIVIERTVFSAKRGGKCRTCGKTTYIDYYVPVATPWMMIRVNNRSQSLSTSRIKEVLTISKSMENKYVISYVVIPPVGIRPSEETEWPTDMARYYSRLVNAVKSGHQHSQAMTVLYNNIVGYLRKGGITKAISGKSGIFRSLMLGKRINRSMRMVIVGDPHLAIDQVMVSSHITDRIRIGEMVWDGNLDKMR